MKLLPIIREVFYMLYKFQMTGQKFVSETITRLRIGKLCVIDDGSGTVNFLRAERGGGLSKFREGQYSMGQEG